MPMSPAAAAAAVALSRRSESVVLFVCLQDDMRITSQHLLHVRSGAAVFLFT
jgi:hypothetical protein